MRIPIILLSILCTLGSGSSFVFKQTDSLPSKARVKSAKFEIDSVLADPRERHLANIKQLTNEGENAEAYFSPDGNKLIFQRAAKAAASAQMFSISLRGSSMNTLSNTHGKPPWSFFTPNTNPPIYAPTFKASPGCPPKPDYSPGSVRALLPGFDILIAGLDGSNVRP